MHRLYRQFHGNEPSQFPKHKQTHLRQSFWACVLTPSVLLRRNLTLRSRPSHTQWRYTIYLKYSQTHRALSVRREPNSYREWCRQVSKQTHKPPDWLASLNGAEHSHKPHRRVVLSGQSLTAQPHQHAHNRHNSVWQDSLRHIY